MVDKKAPDPSHDCPRCHYYEQSASARARRSWKDDRYPGGIDQEKAARILMTAFPPRPRY